MKTTAKQDFKPTNQKPLPKGPIRHGMSSEGWDPFPKKSTTKTK